MDGAGGGGAHAQAGESGALGRPNDGLAVSVFGRAIGAGREWCSAGLRGDDERVAINVGGERAWCGCGCGAIPGSGLSGLRWLAEGIENQRCGGGLGFDGGDFFAGWPDDDEDVSGAGWLGMGGAGTDSSLVVPLSIRVDPIDLDGFWAVVFDVEGGGGAFGAAGARLIFLVGGGRGGGGGGQ